MPATSARPQTTSPQPSAESVAVNVILNAFFRKGDKTEQAMEAASWLRVLRGFDADDILAGWERYQDNGPRDDSGRLGRPSAHCIRQRAAYVVQQRNGNPPPQPWAPPAQQITSEPRERVSAEAAERIVQEAGFNPDHAEAVKRFPTAPNRTDLADRRATAASQAQEDRAAINPDDLRKAREATAIGAAALAEGKALKAKEGAE